MREHEKSVVSSLESEMERLKARAEEHGQGHVFAFWDGIGPEERKGLLRQLESVDFELMDRLITELIDGGGPAATGSLSPAPIVPVPRSAAEKREEAAAREMGEALLGAGRVAAFVVAGGQGTRLGFDAPKGTFRIGPVSDRSLFQLHAEKLIALSRRHRVAIPWYVMTAESNHEATIEFFRQNAFFGLDEADVRFFRQEMLPAVDHQGKFLLETKSRIFTSPNGHGGSLKALHDSGALAEMRGRGIDTIYYFQVDNPLLTICDPVFIGRHALAEAEMSSKVVRKTDWKEKVGVMGLRDGKLCVIEYSDLPEEEARAQLPDGTLKYWAGSIAVHVLAVGFVERLNRGGFRLPYHSAEKAIPYVDETGERRKPAGKNGIKFETFVFDALREAHRSLTMEAPREAEFSPVKEASGVDTPEKSRRDLTALYLRWLEAAGARIERRPDGSFPGYVEISPLAAIDAEEVARKVEPGTLVRPGFRL
jgi:UDP-N-acetylglucosamine/UDP-N-acetylgalactosamine diphosphorylase